MEQRYVTGTIASVVLVAALGSLWLMFRPVTPIVDPGPIINRNTGLGQVLADETIKAIHDQGRVVVVTAYDHDHGIQWRDDGWKAFHHELQAHPGIRIVATEIATPNPREFPAGSCPSAAFKEILQRHAGVDAIVFFLGLPDWARGSEAIIPSLSAKILVADDNSDLLGKWQYGGYLSQGILTALLYSRGDTDTGTTPQPATPREWFNQYYRVYTPQNYESLPAARMPAP